MNTSRPILEVRLQAPLDRFDLNVAHACSHRVLGVFGVSGSGKTTWIEAVAGLRRSAKGFIRFEESVWLDSERGRWTPPEQRGIGYVPQNQLLFPHRTVRGNLEAGKRRALAAGVQWDAHAARVIDQLELRDLLDRPVNDLSGGERQRVALGRALCSGPRLLLLDEPLASLDVSMRGRLLSFLRGVRETFDLPMILVSHNPVEVQALCDELAVLDRGRVIAAGPPLEVLTRPDVFQSAEPRGFENVLAARVKTHEAHTTRVALERGNATSGEPEPPSAELIIPKIDAAAGRELTLSLAASEILLSTAEPKGLSARNRIEARVSSIRAAGHRRLVEAVWRNGNRPMVAEVTADALEELGLAPGGPVYLAFKTSSLRVYF